MGTITTISPIFIVMAIGWVARKRGFIPAPFLAPANRLVFYLAIPAMVFRAISKGTIGRHFNGTGLFICLGSALGVYALAWIISHLRRMPAARAGAFTQSAAHGNHGYVGLPVAFYVLGDQGLVQASIIAGFLMILQNVTSTIVLHHEAARGNAGTDRGKAFGQLLGNPIILSAMAGILCSLFHVPLPLVVQRTLDMLGGLAPPMALLLIGASLSVERMRQFFRPAMGAVLIKLVLLPGIGLLLFSAFGMTAAEFLPGLLLLATPTATVAYVMAREMDGDPDFAVATISASTLFSALTYSLWLMLVHALFTAA